MGRLVYGHYDRGYVREERKKKKGKKRLKQKRLALLSHMALTRELEDQSHAATEPPSPRIQEGRPVCRKRAEGQRPATMSCRNNGPWGGHKLNTDTLDCFHYQSMFVFQSFCVNCGRGVAQYGSQIRLNEDLSDWYKFLARIKRENALGVIKSSSLQAAAPISVSLAQPHDDIVQSVAPEGFLPAATESDFNNPFCLM